MAAMIKIAAIALAVCIPMGFVVSSEISARHKQAEQFRMHDVHSRKMAARAEHSAGHHTNACAIYRQLIAEGIGGDSFTDELEQSCRIAGR